jgi:hypothetical protein
MRGVSLLEKWHVDHFEALMAQNTVKLCIVLPPFQTVLDNWREKTGDYLQDRQQLTQVFIAYEKLCERYWRYDYGTDSPDNRRFLREALC